MSKSDTIRLMRKEPEIDKSLPLLKNGKPHVSYSEVSTWASCPWRHKLLYIEKKQENDTSPYLDYGTIVHEAAEGFLKTRTIDLEVVYDKIREAWKKNKFDTPEFIEAQTARARSQDWKYEHIPLQGWLDSAKNALTDLPGFLDETWPGWKPLSAEYRIYSPIEGETGHFKGFIDCVLELPSGKHVVIDWKTSGPAGWRLDKKKDELTQFQIILYKIYWMKKTGLPSSKVQAAFVLLKRDVKPMKSGKPRKSVDIVEVSSGPKMMERAKKKVSNMIRLMDRGMALKNRYSCRFCEFVGTDNCKP